MIFNKSLLLAHIGLCSMVSSPQSDNHVSKPNIVFILADDMGAECSGIYGGPYDTPNIDEMAKTGIMFTYAYSQPLSTPSRVELLTGKYNYKNYCDFGFLNQDQKTFGNLARMAGYKTAIVGKWQLGANSNLPGYFGFDNYCLWQLNYKRTKTSERYANALIEADGEILQQNEDSYGPDIFIDYIKKFIEKNKDYPFLLYYPMALVHDPFVSTPDSEDWSENIEGRHNSDTTYFPDMVRYCDKNIGRVIEILKENGLYDNTLVIFTGDNGTNKKIFTTMKNGDVIQGGKGMTTDAGTHVALIATFGDNQCAPTICNDLIDFTDIMPTMAQAMGIDIPKEWDTDGSSFLPQICGHKGNPREWVFCHYDSFFNGPDKPDKKAKRYIRNHQYKLYSTGEFYDIENDVEERYSIQPGKGDSSAEKNRKKLYKKLIQFPEWKIGDIPVKPVILPEYPILQKSWKQTDK